MLRQFFVRPLLSLCLLGMCLLSSDAMARTESEIKAFYLYNFIKFVTWPDEPVDTDINICIYGDNPFTALTDKLNTLTVRDRKVNVIDHDELPFSECSVLYVSDSEKHFYNELLTELNNAPVLTVSDIDGFMAEGGMIGFIKVGNLVKFEINLSTARASRLNMSAKLLELASRVEK